VLFSVFEAEGGFAEIGELSSRSAASPRTVWSVVSRTAQAQPQSGSIKPESRRSFLNTVSALK
jgi:hypothetical protein